MLFRFSVYVTLLIFFVDLLSPAMARYAGRSSGRSRLDRPSSNNSYRSVGRERELRRELGSYFAHDIDTLTENAEADFETALRRYVKAGSNSDPISAMQMELKGFLKSKRNLKIPGVRDIDREASFYLPAGWLSKMREHRLTISGIAKSVEAEFDVRGLFEMKDEFFSRSPGNRVIRLSSGFKRFLKGESCFMREMAGSGEMKEIRSHLLALSLTPVEISDRPTFIAGRSTTGRPSSSMAGRVSSTRRSEMARRDSYVQSSASVDDEEDPFLNPSLAEDSWDKTIAAQQKGYKETEGQESHKRNMGLLLVAAGITLIAIGMTMVKSKNPATEAHGWKLIIAGGVLLYLGMEKLGEAAEIGDEQSEQRKQNADIDAARKRLLDKEKARQEEEWKKLLWRKRQKQRSEQEEMMRRQRLQDEAER